MLIYFLLGSIVYLLAVIVWQLSKLRLIAEWHQARADAESSLLARLLKRAGDDPKEAA